MTDSGFSSAASNRSAPAAIRPSLLNPSATTSSLVSSRESTKENLCSAVPNNLPKPSPIFHLTKPVRPNRFFGPKGNGNYSPSLYSPKEMSPMSSLAFDFRDLNTSRDVADTPRKRLSLSSVSSLDSFYIRSQPSPAAGSVASDMNSPSTINDDGHRIPMEVEYDHMIEWKDLAKEQQKRRSLFISYTEASTSVRAENAVKDRVQDPHDADSADDTDMCSPLDTTVKNADIFFRPIAEGCFTDTPSPIDLTEMEARFDQRAMQDRDANVLAGNYGDSKLSKYRRFNSMPAKSRQPSHRSRAMSNKSNGKENSPLFPCGKQSFSKCHGTIDSPSPLHPMVTGASPGFSLARRSSSFVSPKLTSSQLVTNFSSSSSSAFSSVPHSSPQQPTLSKSQSKKQEELRKSAEEVLREAKSPTNVSLTPEKSVVPGSISSLSARTTRLSRPASAAPYCREKTPPRCENISPILVRGNKRTLDTTNTSMMAARKRQKQNSTSETSSTRRRMAFLSKDRKTKSADVANLQSSPISSLKSGFRPISAPALMLSDDDAPLSHSRLCSSNDSDSDDADDVSMTLEHSQQLADEQLVEEMLADNARAKREADGDATMTYVNDVPPVGIDGLITAPLLVSASEAHRGKAVDGSVVERLPRPRELFRSPSAPPLVPRKRLSLLAIHRPGHHCERETPEGRHSHAFIPTLPEANSYEDDDEPNATLNRSRSFNELDIMKAVDLGCSDENLIGDFSRACSLKTVKGKCQDLKYITPETLIDLIERKQEVGCFEIIDCRYPYEYGGGHIKGASHVWEEEALHKKFLQNPRPMWAEESGGSYKPPVMVFYCEFSSERGPRMARALRNKDRSVNRYPHLHYPEIYILKNGYKNFYHTEGTKEYCDPQSYLPMAHRDYSRELRMCRMKCKSWAGESKGAIFTRLKKRF